MTIHVKVLLFEFSTNVILINIEIAHGSSIKELIELIEKTGRINNFKASILDSEGDLKVSIILNNKFVGQSAFLNDQDKVTFLSVVSGG